MPPTKSASNFTPCLQPRQLPAHAGDARGHRAMVADLAARTPDQDRGAAGAPWPLRHLPDGRGRHPTPRLRRHPDHDQRPARAAAIRDARMTISTPRSAAINAGDSKGVFEDRPDHVEYGSKHGVSRAQRPTRSILRENQSEVTCSSRSAPVASPEASHMGNAGSVYRAARQQTNRPQTVVV